MDSHSHLFLIRALHLRYARLPDDPLLHRVLVHRSPQDVVETLAESRLGQPVRKVVRRLDQADVGDLVAVIGLPGSSNVDHEPLLRRVGCPRDDVEQLLGVRKHRQRHALLVHALQVVLDDEGLVERVGKCVDLARHDGAHDATGLLARVGQHVAAISSITQQNDEAQLGRVVVVRRKGRVSLYAQM
ncbi:hypothetical protein I4F81_005146 [Pyropia yezoensis]|uniref:Uncharacterized protein n=1 Tax=Pyropia yezoensis TaxID=2788 RepID=A0ACC3BYB4_PYRYE|nr:hypothetical protein I4F81_005146 [Neopyropia yezoensis]